LFVARPRILSPAPGARFVIDPSGPQRFQAVPLKAVVPGKVRKIAWIIDGHPFTRTPYPYTALWPLKPGRHTVQVTANGRSSEKVKFTVY
jgi:membrane carboxypeptidase/penicillin-binding protein PbpC